MAAQTENIPNKSKPSKLRRVLLLAILGLVLLFALFAGMVGYNLVRPVARPVTRPLGPLEPAPVIKPAAAPTALASNLDSTRSGQLAQMPGKTPAPKNDALELLPVAAQPTAELKAKARAINEAFARLRAEFAHYVEIKKKSNASGARPVQEARAQVYQSFNEVMGRLISDFGPQPARGFDELFLGMLMENQDWDEAAKYCIEQRNDWDGGYYCYRQMDKTNAVVNTVFLAGLRVYFSHPKARPVKFNNLLHVP